MKSILVSLALAVCAAAQINLNTPTGALGAIQCQVYQISWTGGSAPFDVRLLDGGQNFVEEISSSATSSPVAWTVNKPAGQTFILTIHDSQGGTGITAPFQVQSSSNSACLNATASTGGASTSTSGTVATGPGPVSTPASSGASSAPASTATSPAASSAPVSTPHASPSSTVGGTTSAAGAAASATRSSGASALSVGVFGPVVAALIALAA